MSGAWLPRIAELNAELTTPTYSFVGRAVDHRAQTRTTAASAVQPSKPSPRRRPSIARPPSRGAGQPLRVSPGGRTPDPAPYHNRRWRSASPSSRESPCPVGGRPLPSPGLWIEPVASTLMMASHVPPLGRATECLLKECRIERSRRPSVTYVYMSRAL